MLDEAVGWGVVTFLKAREPDGMDGNDLISTHGEGGLAEVDNFHAFKTGSPIGNPV